MDIEKLKTRLLEKEADLASTIARFQTEARGSGQAEVGDEADTAVSSEDTDTALYESGIEYQTLKDVRDALRRIENGTYGRCVDCGREIAPARLEAVPWTPYCREDQEKHDKERHIEDTPPILFRE
jgi:DnaK suppressor protein